MQGYTNAGHLFRNWIGRAGKGRQAWLTFHLSGNEWIQASYRRQKVAKDFIATPTARHGTTVDDYSFQAVKRIGRDLEVNGDFTYENCKAPIYLPGPQKVTVTTIQLTCYPQKKKCF